jgi:hypothetical protein
MNNIWAKTAQSPTNPNAPTVPRPMQTSARRRSVAQPVPAPPNGAKEDPDIDRMLEDNDDSYVPADASGDDGIVWRGKLIQTSEDEAPNVNARFVAGRDLAQTIPWQTLLPHKLSIDGRLQVQKAEDYVCGLRWSSSSDVAVLSLTANDNADAFNNVFDYFHSRQRYAVVEKDKPSMVKDLYIIPVEAGADLPKHVGMLEHCAIKSPVEERLLLATLIVARAPGSPVKDATVQPAATNGHLPPHLRQSIGGPAGSPLTNHHINFSPPQTAPPPPPNDYGMPPAFPPNPYGAPQQQAMAYPPPQPSLPAPHLQPHPDPQVNQILGELQYAPTAQIIFHEAKVLTTVQLQSLRAILTEDFHARTNWDALAKKLYDGTSA